MNSKLKAIKAIAENIVYEIDSGNCNLNEDELTTILEEAKSLVLPRSKYSVYQAAEYLRVSPRTLNNYVNSGKLRKPRSQSGFKEKFWYKEDLDMLIRRK